MQTTIAGHDRQLIDSLSRLGNMLALVRPTPTASPRLVYGDLKPEHVLIDLNGGIVLIDNALHIDEPAQDVARFLLRSALAGHRGLLQRHPGWIDHVDCHQVALLMAIDWFNIVTTWLSASAGTKQLRLPIHSITSLMLDAALGGRDAFDVAERTASLITGATT